MKIDWPLHSALTFIEVAAYHLINVIGHAAMSRGVAEVYMGRAPILHECLMQGLKVCCPLVGAWFIVSIFCLGSYEISFGVFRALGATFGFSDGLWVLLGLLTVVAF